MLAVREDQALVSAMLRQAVRHGLLRANQVVLARDMFTVTKDDDDQLINSNEKSRTIWIVIQQVMAGNQDELREMAAIFTNDTHFDEAKAMRLISVVVKTLIPASSPKANARVIALLSFTSALVEGLYPHGMGAVRSVTSAMEKEIHTLMEEHLIQIVVSSEDYNNN